MRKDCSYVKTILDKRMQEGPAQTTDSALTHVFNLLHFVHLMGNVIDTTNETKCPNPILDIGLTVEFDPSSTKMSVAIFLIHNRNPKSEKLTQIAPQVKTDIQGTLSNAGYSATTWDTSQNSYDVITFSCNNGGESI